MITKRQLAMVLLNGNPVLYHEEEMSDRDILDSLNKAENLLYSEIHNNYKSYTDKEISSRQEFLAVQAVKLACKNDFQSALHEIVDCISDYEDHKTYTGQFSDKESTELSRSETMFLHLLIASVYNLCMQAIALGATSYIILQRKDNQK